MKKLLSKVKNLFREKKGPFINTGNYWEQRYRSNGNSGDGSYGQLAAFKADVINKLIEEFPIRTAIELGCGDGHQLGLINYPAYIGMDISEKAVLVCTKKYAQDHSKRFMVASDENINALKKTDLSDMVLSLDVIYHLVETDLFNNYLSNLFDLSTKVVTIYSTNFNQVDTDHVVHRKFTDWVSANRPDWELLKVIKNPYPGVGIQRSNADFYIYKKK